MINAKMVKILGLVATAVGMGATLLTDWVNEKKMEEKIDERINEKLAALNDEEEESYYIGFRTEKFEEQTISEREEPEQKLIEFKVQPSIFDKECADCPAQYATSSEIPTSKWEKVKTKLSSIDTSKLHYVKVPENHIVIDFDIPDRDGNKSFELNLKEASKWPPTYAELSKSGQGIHLHYIYAEDPAKLSRVYDDHIEVKVFNGKSSLRRKLTKCNTYDRMCLVNDAVYIAKYKDGKHAGEWTATGTQFQVPYVFKKLFSKEPIEFEDMCETKSVTSALYLDMNEGLPDVSALESEKDKLWKQINDPNRMTEPMEKECARIEELTSEIDKGHNYHFIGKVGQFCPIKPGCGGGILLRETENKKTGEKGYAAATGSKGFRWLESEMVRELGKENDIDRTYYNNLVDEAVKSLSSYGDFERFVADEPFVSDNTPPWFGAGEPHEEEPTPFDVR